MISFESDYTEGAHENILRRLVETNLEQTPGYSFDKYTESAKNKIRERFNCKDADVFFLVGGTQTNATVIASVLRNYEGVIAVNTGHIDVHESGAVEYTGHKVLSLPSHNGKMDKDELETYIHRFYSDESHEHMIFPGMVYISFPTELGTIYSKKELSDIHGICQKYSIPLFIDGARLGYGLMSKENDIAIEEFASLCDIFYIGGTKVGALFGEAVVFNNHSAPKHFFTSIKQHGALLAKGRILGLQFDTLFTDDLYFKISANAIELADRLKEVFVKKGYSLSTDSPTNQQFIVMPDDKIEELRQKVRFEVWGPAGDKSSIVRFVTSWATKAEYIEKLEEYL